jgi:hypothetical protein
MQLLQQQPSIHGKKSQPERDWRLLALSKGGDGSGCEILIFDKL